MTRPTAVLLIGIPATGKSTFFRERFFTTHVHISLDLLKSRRRESRLLESCLSARVPFVVDNTNATMEERSPFILPARKSGFRVVGYYFSSKVEDALQRNRLRQGKGRIPDGGVLGIAGRLRFPSPAEGFDELWYVRMDGVGGFLVEPWREDGALPL